MKFIKIFLLNFIFFAFPFPACACRIHSNRPQTPPSVTAQTHYLSLPTDATAEQLNAPPRPAFWNDEHVDVSNVDPKRKLIAFTFDDAPSTTLENLLALYASFNESNPDCPATATFFVNGYRFDNHVAPFFHVANAMQMELGNHTHSHLDLTKQTDEKIRDEIKKTDEILQRFDGKTLHLIRTPFGNCNEKIKELSKTPLINWTIDTLDWQGKKADEIYDTVWKNKSDGAIVLMHDGYEETVSAVKRLLPDLKNAGYQVVGVSQLAKANGCQLKTGSVYIRARKQR